MRLEHLLSGEVPSARARRACPSLFWGRGRAEGREPPEGISENCSDGVFGISFSEAAGFLRALCLESLLSLQSYTVSLAVSPCRKASGGRDAPFIEMKREGDPGPGEAFEGEGIRGGESESSPLAQLVRALH